jgi:hypothetical protein
VIRFQCPHCQATLSAPDGTDGRSTRCSACRGPVTVPTPAVLRSMLETEPVPVGAVEAVPDESPLPKQRRQAVPRRSAALTGSCALSVIAALAALLAVTLSLIGVAMLAYYFLLYDTVVYDVPGRPDIGGVSNVGLMHNRLVGIIIGATLFMTGAVMGVIAMLSCLADRAE